MIDYLDIQNKIVAKLKKDIPEVAVEVVPNNPSIYNLIHPVGAILVFPPFSTYSENRSAGFYVNQAGVLNVTVSLGIREMFHNTKGLGIKKKIMESLLAFSLDYSTGSDVSTTWLKLDSDGSPSFDDEGKIWHYELDFSGIIQLEYRQV
jgi:hypothetical protein